MENENGNKYNDSINTGNNDKKILSTPSNEKPVQASGNDTPAQPQKSASGQTLRQVTEAKKQEKEAALLLASTSQKRMKTIFFSLLGVTVAAVAGFAGYMILGRPEPTVVDPVEIEEVQMFSATHYFDDEHPNVPDDVEIHPAMRDELYYAYAADQHLVGMLSVPGTCIDMAVYRTTDNSFYLKGDLKGNYSRYGTVFMDCNGTINCETRNTVVYGHNFDDNQDGKQDDIIFGDLLSFLDVEYYKKYPVFEYRSLYTCFKFKIIACFLTNGDISGDSGYLFNYVATDMSDECFLEFIDEIRQRSFINTTVDVVGTDKIFTLSTCQYEWDRNGATQNARCVLIGRMVRDGESEEVDVSGATQNENPRMPQLYYNVFGGENPYASAEKWYPYL